MKKILIPLLCTTLTLSLLVACGGNDDVPETNDDIAPPVTEGDDTANDGVVTPDDAVVVAPLPGDDDIIDEGGTEVVVTPPETETEPETTTNPTEPTPDKDIETEEETDEAVTEDEAETLKTSIWDAYITKINGETQANAEITPDVLTALYGISTDDLLDYVAYMPMINVSAEEYFIAKVAEGKMDTVEDGIMKRQSDLETTWSTYLPEQYELVKDYTLIKKGDYILFAIAPDTSAIEEIFNSVAE